MRLESSNTIQEKLPKSPMEKFRDHGIEEQDLSVISLFL